MSEGYPAERFSIAAVAPKQTAALIRFGQTPDLDPTIHELVALRASQLNGCAFCIDMHWLDARADGEGEARLYGLDAWRESPLYDDRERAALGLCEAVTSIDREGVPDAVWAEARAHFEESELAQLLCAIAATNTWNRLQVATRALPGNYAPADREAVGAEAAG
ncbi:MAG TPA: carboxymuconolactone decarboxylase family protein [Solirubrobacterales bacterium]|jgi:AhpD family alkylhydroperoxidase|nr:carboxymuconolactone decarboxylase family protein [Solirubrobacterales bacterium]